MQCTEASDSVAWPLSYLYVHFTRGYLPGTAEGQKIWGATLHGTNILKRPKKFEKKILLFVLTLQSNRCLMVSYGVRKIGAKCFYRLVHVL